MWIQNQNLVIMTSYKQDHENFVTGHNGTSHYEIAMTTSISCVSCFVRDLVVLSSGISIRPSQWIGSRILTDFLLLVLPNIVSVTVLSNHIGLLLLILLLPSLIYSCHLVLLTRKAERTSLSMHQVNLSDKKNFITYFRSIVNVCTAVAILAVDFPVFPRRLAKTETYGFGGMDTGVGFFVVANAIVSQEARGKYSTSSHVHHLKKAVISCLPLLLLGFARLISVKGADYHEHVTEYGVHWNFFFTLAVLKVFLTMIYCVIPVRKSAAVAVLLVVFHQIILSNGLSSYIINGADGKGGRLGLIDANREGIYSLPGYMAIYMIGVQLGRFLFQNRNNLDEWIVAGKHLNIVFAISSLLMICLHNRVESVSRRFANAAFVLWIITLSSLMLLECLLADIAITYIRAALRAPTLDNRKTSLKTEGLSHSHPEKVEQTSSSKDGQGEHDRGNNLSKTNDNDEAKNDSMGICLMDAISYNSLLFFLLANLMTGMINMNISTIHTAALPAVAILFLYMLILCVIVKVLRVKNISTKLW